MSARHVVAADVVEKHLLGAVARVVDFRAVLVDVDLHAGIDRLDGRPGVAVDVVVAEAVEVDEIELREPGRIRARQRGSPAVVDGERGNELGRGRSAGAAAGGTAGRRYCHRAGGPRGVVGYGVEGTDAVVVGRAGGEPGMGISG